MAVKLTVFSLQQFFMFRTNCHPKQAPKISMELADNNDCIGIATYSTLHDAVRSVMSGRNKQEEFCRFSGGQPKMYPVQVEPDWCTAEDLQEILRGVDIT